MFKNGFPGLEQININDDIDYLITEAGIVASQAKKVLRTLIKAHESDNQWVDAIDLMADFNSAARNRISELRRQGISIDGRKGKGATWEYRLTPEGFKEIIERAERASHA